ncbi:cora-domain-containing protein [Ascodesmis nigricans]|uniref:Magnesium transporter n=1 Tax=Ascodesmis nigricans TaxID=341454 RepID=A0A4S2MQ14_9PEZI|nr:cora-domain-containing protein [Ascodesmis nigricans]
MRVCCASPARRFSPSSFLYHFIASKEPSLPRSLVGRRAFSSQKASQRYDATDFLLPRQYDRPLGFPQRGISHAHENLYTAVPGRRSASSSFMKTLFGRKSEQPRREETRSSRYLGSPSEDDILGRALRQKSHSDDYLRCTEFDEEGNVTVVSGEFKKSELCSKHGLQPRDLRKIWFPSIIVPHILIRKNSILVNLLHIRALIKADTVLLFDVYGSNDSYTQSVFMYDLEGKLRQGSKAMGGLPYEMRALEAILISVTAALEAEMKVLQELVIQLLGELEDDINRDQLRQLLIYSKKLSTFEQKARLVRNAIDELLEADDDLADMYLTEKKQGYERPEEEHTEVEMLLESYHKICDEIVQISSNLVQSIRSTEEIVNIILDANRNSLMLLDLKFSIGTLGLGAGTLVAGLYGMNLKNFIEESDFAFFGVSAWTFIFSAIICVYGLHKLRRTQRLTMWGEGGVKGKKGWLSLGKSQAKSVAPTLPKPTLLGGAATIPTPPAVRANKLDSWPTQRALPPIKRT